MKPSTKHWRKKTPAKHRSYSEKRNRDEKIIQQEDEEFFDDEDVEGINETGSNLPNEIDFPPKYKNECAPDPRINEIDFPTKFPNECASNLPDDIILTPDYDGFHPEQFPCEITEEDLKKWEKKNKKEAKSK